MKFTLVNSNCVRSSLLNALSTGWRLDLRKLLSYRNLYLRIGSQSLCCARIGSTIVSAIVKAEVVEPKNSRPSEGLLQFNLAFLSAVSVSDSRSRPNEYVNEIRTLLRDSLLQSGSLDLESLCIVSGEKVWSLAVNLTVLNADGNILDCASLAAIASLASFSLPCVTVEGRCMRAWDPKEKDKVPIVINHYPLFVTFCLFHDGKTVVIDPTESEEKLAESKLFIAMNSRQELCALKSVSKKKLLQEQLQYCVSKAQDHVKAVTALLSEKLAAFKASNKELKMEGDHYSFREIFDQSFDLPCDRLLSSYNEDICEGQMGDGGNNTWVTNFNVEDENGQERSTNEGDAISSKSAMKDSDDEDKSVVIELSEFQK